MTALLSYAFGVASGVAIVAVPLTVVACGVLRAIREDVEITRATRHAADVRLADGGFFPPTDPVIR